MNRYIDQSIDRQINVRNDKEKGKQVDLIIDFEDFEI